MSIDVGDALKIILERLKQNATNNDTPNSSIKEYKHDGTADCLNCKHCIRYEYYDGQWGMFKYDKKCAAGVFVIIDGKINPWSMPCDKFEYGKPKIESMTEEEKRSY